MRAYTGGSDKPLMLSSGLEDYFLGTLVGLEENRSVPASATHSLTG